jgi:hypothetical protein
VAATLIWVNSLTLDDSRRGDQPSEIRLPHQWHKALDGTLGQVREDSLIGSEFPRQGEGKRPW